MADPHRIIASLLEDLSLPAELSQFLNLHNPVSPPTVRSSFPLGVAAQVSQSNCMLTPQVYHRSTNP
jgi:hypothetical protein